MDFFESQDHARRSTRLLVVFFAAAVLALVVLTNLLILAVANFQNSHAVATGQWYYSWPLFFVVSGFVVVFIALGSIYRIISLSKGGESIAEMLDGVLLADHGGDLKKRRLLNVVEEMAIASGTPVPPVYLIADDSINAFAAGYSPGDAVIGITEGAVENLNRDQLQGVIAHEFSHILNGDMRLNIRLMGVLFGILMLAIIGRIILSPGRTTAATSSRRSGGAVIALGIGLLVLGYVGRFFGSLIKAAVSRQREFLADAFAVQFTRNPDGIAGALKRIGGYTGGSLVANGNSEEVSHAFFAQGVKVMFSSMMATHPPLSERIKRIDPSWDGGYLVETPGESVTEREEAAVSGFAAGAGSINRGEASGAIEEIGNPEPDKLAMARGILASMPAALAEAARQPYSARAVAYIVLLDDDVLSRERQLEHLKESADPFVYQHFIELREYASDITPEMKLPFLEMALPSLRQLSAPQYTKFKENVAALVRADNRISLSEWALSKYLTHHLEEAFEGKRGNPRYGDYRAVRDEIGTLLSMLAFADNARDTAAATRAFDAGRDMFELDLALVDKKELSLTAINSALDTLRDLKPLKKPRLLKAAIAVIAADDVIAPVEAELVRTIADSLDCPMPPLVSPSRTTNT